MKAVVRRVEKAAPDAVSIYFDNIFSNYLPGQYIRVQAKVENENISRSYSLITSPFTDEQIGITVRSIEGGLMSNFLLQHAKEEMILDISEPKGEFILKPYQKRSGTLIFFAAGSGITPIFSMIKTALLTTQDINIHLFYSNRSFDHIIFNKQLNELQEKYPGKLHIYHILNDASGAPDDFQVAFEGILSRLLIRKYVRHILTEGTTDHQFYLCGPFAYMQLIEESLLSLDLSQDRIFKEHFFIPENEFNEDELEDRAVLIIQDDQEVKIDVPKGRSILSAALEYNMKMRYSCTIGQCGQCRAKVLQGEVKMKRNSILTSEELQDGQVLLCQGYPFSDNVTIDYRTGII